MCQREKKKRKRKLERALFWPSFLIRRHILAATISSKRQSDIHVDAIPSLTSNELSAYQNYC
jgi:hypothetical protein